MVLGVNTADDATIAREFLVEKGVTFPNVLDTRPEAAQAMMAYETLGMSAVPLTYLIDPQGKVIDAWYGYQKGKAEAALGALGLGAVPVPASVGQEVPVYEMRPIGRVEHKDGTVAIRLDPEYADGLLGLEQWSHVNVVWWFDQNDVTQKRRILQVHPRGDRSNPLTGVFACRAPVRPNLIALSACRILSVGDGVVVVDDIDAFDGTPVLDLKPVIPADVPEGVKVPDWARRRQGGQRDGTP